MPRKELISVVLEDEHKGVGTATESQDGRHWKEPLEISC